MPSVSVITAAGMKPGLRRSQISQTVAREPRNWADCQAALLPSVEALFGFVPVHYAPPRRDILGPAILIFQIVRVLPDIETDYGELSFHQRRVLVGGGNDINLARGLDQP